jgi:hypothetical protein
MAIIPQSFISDEKPKSWVVEPILGIAIAVI